MKVAQFNSNQTRLIDFLYLRSILCCMLDQEILKHQLLKDNLINQLNRTNSILMAKHQQLTELYEGQQDNLGDESTRIEQNMLFMEKKLQQINAFCKEKLEEKKKITSNLQKYSEKKQALSIVFQSQSQKLQEAKAANSQLEEQIKLSRLQYEELQDQIFNLDIKNENLKKFGLETVPQEIAKIIGKTEDLQRKNLEMDRRLQAEKSSLEKMYTKSQYEKISKEIQQLELRAQKMDQLIQQIRQLQTTNQELNKIKSQYQWNPNLQIKKLQLNEQEQQSKISSIEKEISAMRKKSTQCLQKIQMYKNYQQKQESLQKQGSNSPGKASSKEKIEKDNRTKIYSSIKRELEMEDQAKNTSVIENIKLRFQGTGQQSNQTFILDERTYRINKKVNLVQFWVLVITFIVCLYFTNKLHKK